MFRPPSHWKDLKDLVDSRIPDNLMNLPLLFLMASGPTLDAQRLRPMHRMFGGTSSSLQVGLGGQGLNQAGAQPPYLFLGLSWEGGL